MGLWPRLALGSHLQGYAQSFLWSKGSQIGQQTQGCIPGCFAALSAGALHNSCQVNVLQHDQQESSTDDDIHIAAMPQRIRVQQETGQTLSISGDSSEKKACSHTE